MTSFDGKWRNGFLEKVLCRSEESQEVFRVFPLSLKRKTPQLPNRTLFQVQANMCSHRPWFQANIHYSYIQTWIQVQSQDPRPHVVRWGLFRHFLRRAYNCVVAKAGDVLPVLLGIRFFGESWWIMVKPRTYSVEKVEGVSDKQVSRRNRTWSKRKGAKW